MTTAPVITPAPVKTPTEKPNQRPFNPKKPEKLPEPKN